MPKKQKLNNQNAIDGIANQVESQSRVTCPPKLHRPKAAPKKSVKAEVEEKKLIRRSENDNKIEPVMSRHESSVGPQDSEVEAEHAAGEPMEHDDNQDSDQDSLKVFLNLCEMEVFIKKLLPIV